MKKIIRVLALCLAMLSVVVMCVGCGPSKEEVAGVYSGTYEYNGSTIGVAVVLTAEGKYSKATAKGGEISSSESGDYEIKGNKINLYNSESSVYHGMCITYKYKKGTLVNNGHVLTKTK